MCRYQRALALFHFCTGYHGGQNSREYACLSRLETVHGFRPSRSEEYASCLARPENMEARAIYVRLATAAEGRDGITSGYIRCVCCSADMMADDDRAESGVTMCDECMEADCDPNGGCSREEDESEDESDCEDDSEDAPPKCEIRWINCEGFPTPDDNDAVGFAVIGDRRYPICAAHLETMGRTHAHPDCTHESRGGAAWTFEPFEVTK